MNVQIHNPDSRWQPSVRFNTCLHECNHYYPYGVLIAGTMPPDNEQPYKYSAKELDRENGLDWYDFAARMYDPTLGRFTTMDPLCEKTPWLSPYLYCAANPVRYTDPTGMDIWDIDRRGHFRNHVEDRDKDQLFVVNDDGERTDEGVTFKYGTIKKAGTRNWSSNGSYNSMQVRGDRNATRAFEYLAQRSDVEWSLGRFGVEGDKALNVLTTSHLLDKEFGMINLFNNQFRFGYHFREWIHSHPQNTEYPSGLKDKKNSGDIYVAKQINCLGTGPSVNFKLYLPGYDIYIPYDYNSKETDFPILLRGVEVIK